MKNWFSAVRSGRHTTKGRGTCPWIGVLHRDGDAVEYGARTYERAGLLSEPGG